MKSFKELKVWQKWIELVAIVYKITASFPEGEKYSNSQNLVDFKQFLSIARGSCAELDTQIIISHKLGFIQDDDFNKLSPKVEELSKMLPSFYSKINSNSPTR